MNVEEFTLLLLKFLECLPREIPYLLNGIRELFQSFGSEKLLFNTFISRYINTSFFNYYIAHKEFAHVDPQKYHFTPSLIADRNYHKQAIHKCEFI